MWRVLLLCAVVLCVCGLADAGRGNRRRPQKYVPSKKATHGKNAQHRPRGTPNKVPEQKSLRQQQMKLCGSETDCVHVKCPKGGVYLVDGLNLRDKEVGESVADVEKRLPKWFGPKRPFACSWNGKALDYDVPLSHYDVDLGHVLNCDTVGAGNAGGEL